MTELPFGCPDADLRYLRATLSARPPLLPLGNFRLAFAGALGPGMLPAVAFLFAAIAELRRSGRQLSVHFYGTSYDPSGPPAALALAQHYGVQDCVFEHPHRLRYFDAMQVSLEADANLLLGSTDLAFTPSKILAVLACGRPVLALAPAGSAMVSRLALLGEECVTFAPGAPALTGADDIVARLQAILAAPARADKGPWLAPFSAQATATRQLDLLATAAGRCL